MTGTPFHSTEELLHMSVCLVAYVQQLAHNWKQVATIISGFVLTTSELPYSFVEVVLK
jgi:hypothetical protein